LKEKDIKEEFGVSHSTIHDWANKPNHTKKNLAILLKKMTLEEAKEILKREK